MFTGRVNNKYFTVFADPNTTRIINESITCLLIWLFKII